MIFSAVFSWVRLQPIFPSELFLYINNRCDGYRNIVTIQWKGKINDQKLQSKISIIDADLLINDIQRYKYFIIYSDWDLEVSIPF